MKLSLRSGNEMEDDTSIGYLHSEKASGTREGRHPHRTEDKWLEIEIGEFFNGQDDHVVEMRWWEIEDGGWKHGLVVHGIELRPKEK
ncbi:putative F-box protein PP2-B12 [Morella rubra]|uniref:Putative F-box protein PP2-B12 n=1 Tax=Morella rubra TaxID=262757 RepID=A0A6A1VJU1_9ROSI|nr:putative F-box protein PP2-B12 [Morella rubra]